MIDSCALLGMMLDADSLPPDCCCTNTTDLGRREDVCTCCPSSCHRPYSRLLKCCFVLSLFLCSGLFCEEVEGVCSPGRNPCQHQSTCISTPTGPRWQHTCTHMLTHCQAQQSFWSHMSLKIQTHKHIQGENFAEVYVDPSKSSTVFQVCVYSRLGGALLRNRL